MFKRFFTGLALLLAVSLCPDLSGAAAATIQLPPADKTGGMPLMQALHARQSNRGFKSEALPESEISNLLWATCGINRSDGKRTVPTARNEQKLLLHVATESGVWLYNAENHSLEQVMAEDMRSRLGDAPLTLIFSAPAEGEFSGMHVGSMYQNAGLYCASAGLASVVKASGVGTMRNLPLPAGYRVFMTQAVGFAK